MLRRKHSGSGRPKKIVKVRLMCQGRKDEVWSVASSVEVCSLKENYKKNKNELSQDLMWIFNDREIHDDESMFEIGMKYTRENVIMIMKRNSDRPSSERDCHVFNVDKVTVLDDEEHEAPLDNYRDLNIDLTEDEYLYSSESDEDYNDKQERFEKMKKVKDASEKRKDRQTSSVKLAEEVENYKGNLEIGDILKNIGEHNVEMKPKPKKEKAKKKKSSSRTKLKESLPENIEPKAMVEQKQNDKKIDANDVEVLIEQSTESTDDNLDLSSWEKVSKGSRKKPKNPGREKKPEEGKNKKYIVKSFEDSWPHLESNQRYMKTIVSSRNNVVDQNKKILDESDFNANIKASKEVADCNANIEVAEEEAFSIKSEVNQLDESNETAKESHTVPSSISVSCQQAQRGNLGSNDDISQANDSHVTKSPLFEQSFPPLPKVTNDSKSNIVLQELSPTPKTIDHKIIKGNVTEVKKSILDGLPKIENDFCPIKTCPLVLDVVPFGPQTKTVNHFQTIQSSTSNIKSPFGCEYGSSSNAGQTENSEYGSFADNAKLDNSHEGTPNTNADLVESSQSTLALIDDRCTNTGLQEDELAAVQPNWIPEAEETCTTSGDENPEGSRGTPIPNWINEGEKLCTSLPDANSEYLQCGASYGTKELEDLEPVHERQSVISQPEFTLESRCLLSQEGLAAVSQQNCHLPPALPVENLPHEGPSKSSVTALSISALSFGLDSAETPPANVSSDDKTYKRSPERPHNLLDPQHLNDLHINEESNFNSKVSNDTFVTPPEDLLSPLQDVQPLVAPEPGQQIVFLQPLVFFCAPQVPQLPCVPQSQVNVTAIADTSQERHAFFGASQQPNAFLGASQQPNAFFGASQQPNAFLGASRQPYTFSGSSYQSQLFVSPPFSDSTQAPVMLPLPPNQSPVGSPQLQTHLTAQPLPQQYQLAGTGQLHQGRAQQHSEQFPSSVQQEKQLFSALPQPQQQFMNGQYSQLSNVQQQLPSEQQQLLFSQQQFPSEQQQQLLLTQQLSSVLKQQQQQLPFVQQQHLPFVQQQQLPSVQQQHLPFVQQEHLPSVQQQHLPSVLQQQLLPVQQHLPFVEQQHFPSVQQQLPPVHQHLLPALEQQRPYALQQFSNNSLPQQQQQQLASDNLYVQKQDSVDPQLQYFPSVQQQQHSVVSELQQFLSVQQQHTVVPELQQFPSVHQYQHSVVPEIQQFPSVQQQQQLGVNLPESNHSLPICLPVEHSQQLGLNLPHQQVLGSSEHQQIQAQQLPPVQQIYDENQPQYNISAP